LTNRIVGYDDGDRSHSGITDYLFRHYSEKADIQSDAMKTLVTRCEDQTCLHEIFRFLHANAFEQSIGNQKTQTLDAKLDALETIIGNGDDNIGHQADSLEFPKDKDDNSHHFSINMIALLKHLENQSDRCRKETNYTLSSKSDRD